ncbi:MAG: adenosylcobinamide-GDP ribazoletransferase [Verrucomicrobia bacterium]|nr:adenosylcobinamide-GDP ribazoletransferase [Verrucomicrobiota bacterium]MCH8526594.1 adenosylcobinamide-GDP ribazoletransferase [Kiritimatiellia bacterium]
MIRREIHLFFTALMFFTRLPCPKNIDHDADTLNASQKYFPVMGWIVGGFAWLTCWLALHLFPAEIAVLLSICASVLLTGAFHEDGFTDTCDAFGGGFTKEQILTIMKDSRIGAYGVLGILLLILLKVHSLTHLIESVSPRVLAAVFISAHTGSRYLAGTFVSSHNYVQDLDQSKSKPIAKRKPTRCEQIQALIFTLIPFALFGTPAALLLLPLLFLVKFVLAPLFTRKIGGYTGDTLGATQQVAEVWFYLLCMMPWNWF